MSVEDLLNKIEELLDEGKPSMIGGKVKVDSDAIRAVVSEIHLSMPDEVIQARKIAAERQRILKEANDLADAKIKAGEREAAKLVEDSAIVRGANEKAAEIAAAANARANEHIEKAKADAKDIVDGAQKWASELRSGASEFVETVMRESDQILSKCMDDMSANLTSVKKAKQQIEMIIAKKNSRSDV